MSLAWMQTADRRVHSTNAIDNEFRSNIAILRLTRSRCFVYKSCRVWWCQMRCILLYREAPQVYKMAAVLIRNFVHHSYERPALRCESIAYSFIYNAPKMHGPSHHGFRRQYIFWTSLPVSVFTFTNGLAISSFPYITFVVRVWQVYAVYTLTSGGQRVVSI